MYKYNVKLRLGGLVTNEVIKKKIPPAEVILLRAIHGQDAVIIDDEVGKEAADDLKVREDLAHRYRLDRISKNRTKVSLFNLFGHPHVPLPQRLPGYSGDEAGDNKKQLKRKVTPPVDAVIDEIDPDDIVG